MTKVFQDWTYGGVRLSEIGHITELDAYLDMPTKRGDNILIPLKHGRVWVAKYFDQRTISFGLEIVGQDIYDLEQKLDTLKRLIGMRIQQALSHNYCDGPRSALAEVLATYSPTRDPDPLVTKVVLDFVMASPFFRGLTAVTHVIDIAGSPYTVDNPGTAEECEAVIRLAGPLDHPVITNSINGLALEYNDVINGGEWVDINCKDFTALTNAVVNVVGSIIHTGDIPFMILLPGNNTLVLTDATGTNAGTATIDSYPPFL